MSNRLLFIDTETGGVDPQKHSLLSIGVVVWDAFEEELFSDEYYIRSRKYNVTKTAARLNHFDEDRQNDLALDPECVVEKLIAIKEQYFGGYQSVPLAGHNITFDIQFIKMMFSSCGRSFEKLFSHRSVDTYSIIKYLSDCKILPDEINSSAKAFKYFKIPVNGRHTALGDARATMQLYSKLISKLKEKS